MPTKIKYDLRPYIDAIRALKRELIAHAQKRQDFPIARIFEIMPIRVVTPGGRNLLEHRGGGRFKFSSKQEGADNIAIYTNDSAKQDPDKIDYLDDCLGKIESEIPVVFSFSFKLGDDIELNAEGPHRVVVQSIERLNVSGGATAVFFPLTLQSIAISNNRMIQRYLDLQNSPFIIDGGLPVFAAAVEIPLKDPCSMYDLWTRPEHGHTHCIVQRSTTDPLTNGWTKYGTYSSEETATAKGNDIGCVW